eukprot:jgi/Mesvir1/25879/Mv18524-RA.1
MKTGRDIIETIRLPATGGWRLLGRWGAVEDPVAAAQAERDARVQAAAAELSATALARARARAAAAAPPRRGLLERVTGGRWGRARAAEDAEKAEEAARAALEEAAAPAADSGDGWDVDEDEYFEAEGMPAIYENSEDDDDYEDRFTKRAGYVPMYVPMYTGARVLPKRGGHTTGARRVRGRSRTRR